MGKGGAVRRRSSPAPTRYHLLLRVGDDAMSANRTDCSLADALTLQQYATFATSMTG